MAGKVSLQLKYREIVKELTDTMAYNDLQD